MSDIDTKFYFIEFSYYGFKTLFDGVLIMRLNTKLSFNKQYICLYGLYLQNIVHNKPY